MGEKLRQMVLNVELKHIIESQDGLLRKDFKKNDMLFSEGDEPRGIYCVQSGKVKIVLNQPHNHQRIVHFAAKGEILGLHAVVNNHPYTNSAVALDKTKTVFFESENFLRLIESDNAYKLLVMKTLCTRIETMEHHINLISDMHTEQRFADLLKSLIYKFGLNQKRVIKINLSLDELASYACTSRSYMKKIITDFSQKGLLSYQNGDISVIDRKKIESIALNEKNFSSA